MSNRIGPRQKYILTSMSDGQELLMDNDGYWQLDNHPVDRERCGSLHLRGFIMQGELYASGWRKYDLTDKGKAAL